MTNPKKNKLYNVMKDIVSKFYYMNKFIRISDDKFIEDDKELTQVGEEIFNEFFKMTDNKINFFVDICAAPGMYSKILLDKYKDTMGIGISLPPEKGGVKFEIDYDNYKIFYKDILEKTYKLELPKKLDFGIASCVSYIDTQDSYALNSELILASSDLILSNLNEKGTFIINLTIKNIYVCYNLIHILSQYFKEYKLWKSLNVWGTKNTIYFFGYGFRENYENDLKKYISMIQNRQSEFSNNFIYSEREYKEIDKRMNEIYKVRINAWLNLISKN
jgi:hypothetical protein